MKLTKSISIAMGLAAVLLGADYLAIPPSVSTAAAATARDGGRSHRHGTGYREYNNPDAYRTGSGQWWEEMDRQNRGGR